jgi:hypothetical protein
MDAHKEKAQEQKQLSKLNGLQHQVLEVVAGEWMTRRQVCDELEIEWSDRGRNKAAQQVARALSRLVEIEKIESVRAGIESTYRSLDRIGTEKDVTLMTVMSPSHTKGLDVITFETPNDDSDDNSHTNGSADAPVFTEEKLATMTSMTSLSSMSSDETNQSEMPLSLDDITVITDSVTFNSNEKKSDHIQSTINLFDLTPDEVGSGADVDASGDDPHWPARAPAA